MAVLIRPIYCFHLKFTFSALGVRHPCNKYDRPSQEQLRFLFFFTGGQHRS